MWSNGPQGERSPTGFVGKEAASMVKMRWTSLAALALVLGKSSAVEPGEGQMGNVGLGMTPSESHSCAEEMAAAAQLAAQSGDGARASELFLKAAEAETARLETISQVDKEARSAAVVNAARLWCRTGRFEESEQLIYAWLRSNSVSDTAKLELTELLKKIWDARTEKYPATIVPVPEGIVLQIPERWTAPSSAPVAGGPTVRSVTDR